MELAADLHGKILLDGIVALIRQVRWGQSRTQLEKQANEFGREGSMESGWDNYSTAAWLRWKEDLYNAAAQARFPRDGDADLKAMIHGLDVRLYQFTISEPYDDDIGEREAVRRRSFAAVLPDIQDPDQIAELKKHYQEKGFLFDRFGPSPIPMHGDDWVENGELDTRAWT
jgi:hypothetical protein